MRILVGCTFLLACCLLAVAGCSGNAVEWNKEATVSYDKARDGEPKVMGGPGGGKMPAGWEKKRKGGAAPTP
jgi:hypothetical protein